MEIRPSALMPETYRPHPSPRARFPRNSSENHTEQKGRPPGDRLNKPCRCRTSPRKNPEEALGTSDKPLLNPRCRTPLCPPKPSQKVKRRQKNGSDPRRDGWAPWPLPSPPPFPSID